MKKLWLPLLCSKETFVADAKGGKFFGSPEPFQAYNTQEKAEEAAKALAMAHPHEKVVIFAAISMVQPSRIEFVQKEYNSAGELIV